MLAGANLSVYNRRRKAILHSIAALNDLEVLTEDVQNANLNAPTKEKVYTTAELELGTHNVGRPDIII